MHATYAIASPYLMNIYELTYSVILLNISMKRYVNISETLLIRKLANSPPIWRKLHSKLFIKKRVYYILSFKVI